jgi:methyl-accepting chemotaxis protein
MNMGLTGRLYLNCAISITGLLLVACLALASLNSTMQADALKRTKGQVEAAASIVQSLQVAEARGQLTRAAAEAEAKKVLSSIRYNGGNYVFVLGDGGRMVMHPILPRMDGQGLDAIRDIKGSAFFATLYREARDQGSTTVRYVWPRPGQTASIAKLSYGVKIPEWDWVIASGVYLDEVSAELFRVGITLMLLIAGLTGGVAILTGRSAVDIGRAVKLATVELDALGRGELERDIPGVGRADEAGNIARALASMQSALRERMDLTKAAEHHKLDVERRLADAERRHVEAAQQQTETLGALKTSLGELAAGRLASRIDRPFAHQYEELRTDFNAAADRLKEAMGAIATVTQGIKTGSGEISGASDDLSRRTEQQAASLEQTAAAMEQLTVTVTRSAGGVKQAHHTASEAKSDAVRSGEVMKHAVQAMAEIEQGSAKVTQIIGVIDEIAFQTNLLALNAGVEAARAGDSGRGFAVVAQEVRALAQRSAEAAKEIRGLIADSSKQVGRGVHQVSETGLALSSIVSKVMEVEGLLADIALSTEQQATGLSQVNTAINQMDQVTQKNAAMVEQTAAAATSLKDDARLLDEMVGRFDLGTDRADAARRPIGLAVPRAAGARQPRAASVR